jgi:type III secretion protein J
VKIPDFRDDETWASTWIWLFVVAVFAVGCQEEVYHGLSERQANRLVVALEQQGVSADKLRGASGEGNWTVTVPSGQKVRAWKLLEARGLPEPKTDGFDEFYPTGGLIPTASEERILYQYATSQELRETLLKVDGVVDAQVNLVLPEKPRVQLSNTEVEPPRASVLVKYQAGERTERGKPPVSREEIERLVAGGVERLQRENVDVVLSAARNPVANAEEPDFARVGPVSVAPGSTTTARAVIGGLGILVLLLGGGVAYLLWQRLRDDDGGREL